MTDITKKVDRGVPTMERQAIFTQLDAGAGDVILVEESMGFAAKNVFIASECDLTIKFNVYRYIFPRRPGNDIMYSAGEPNVTLGQRYHDDQISGIDVPSGTTFDNDGEFPVRSIEIVTCTGDYEILITR